MKKFLYSALALGALLSMSSCASEEPLGQKENDGKVQFVINLDGVQTRAYGETTSCNQLVYTVFDMDGKVVLEDQTQTLTPGAVTTTVNLQLVANQQYQVIFYAHNTNSEFSSYENGVITVDYDKLNVNSNVDDAFINKKSYKDTENQVFKADGNAKTVYLTRPFAQVNIGTDDLGNPAVQKILADVTTELNITQGLYTTYTAIGEGVSNELTSTVTASTGAPEVNTDFPLTPYSNLLSMYMLVPQTQDMINATYTINLAGKPAINTLNLNGMPVQGNYRTNVYGSLLTTQNQFNVVIDPNFEGVAGKPIEGYPGLTKDVNGVVHASTPQGLASLHDYIGSKYPFNETVMIDADIDASGMTWKANWKDGAHLFTFDGQNHTISNLDIQDGFFTGVGGSSVETAVVKNITFKKCNTTGGWCGTVWAYMYGNVIFDNVHVDSCTVTGDALVGGMIGGYGEGNGADYGATFINCSVTNSTITAKGTEYTKAGASQFVGFVDYFMANEVNRAGHFGTKYIKFGEGNSAEGNKCINPEGMVGGGIYTIGWVKNEGDIKNITFDLTNVDSFTDGSVTEPTKP